MISTATSRRPSLVLLAGMLLALIAVEGTLRVRLAATSETIAQDGTLFLEIAQTFPRDPNKAMYKFGIHPGYPAAVAAVHHLLTGHDDVKDRELWEKAGQYVSIVASLLAIVAIWVFGSMLFNNVWIGYFGALLLGLGRKFAITGADVLSDSLMLCFAMWGLVATMQALRMLESRRKMVLLWAALAGAGSAAAYWIRPEGLVVMLIAVTSWLGIQVRRRYSWPLTLISILLAVSAFAAVAAPYGISVKWKMEEFVHAPVADSSALLACLGASDLATTPAILQFVGRFFEAQHPLLASLTCLYLVLWILSKTRFGIRLRESLPNITYSGGAIVIIAFLWIAPTVILRYCSTGVLSHRYLFLLTTMLAGAPVAAIFAISRSLANLSLSDVVKHRIRVGIPAIIITGIAVGLLTHTLRPMHSSHLFAKQAGLWLSQRIQPGDGLLTDHFCVGYYSQTNRVVVVEDSSVRYFIAKYDPKLTQEEYIQRLLNQSVGFKYIALIRQKGPSLLRDISRLLYENGYEPIQEFPYIEKGKARPDKRSIVIYERLAPTTSNPAWQKIQP